MNIKLVIAIISACVGVLWVWSQVYPSKVLYRVQSDTDTSIIPMMNLGAVGSIIPKVKQDVIQMEQHNIILDKKIFQTKQQLRYWDREQRTFQLYSPPPNSRARSGWIEDYNAAKSHKKYYKKRLNNYKSLKK